MNTDKIEKKILLRAPIHRIWLSLTDSKEFGRWFGVRFESPFEQGSLLRGVIVPTEVDEMVAEAQKAYEGLPFEITVEQIEAERLFSFRWHPFAVDKNVDYSQEPTTLVQFELEETLDGVLLTVSESGFDRIPIERRVSAFSANDEGWSMVVTLVEKYLARCEN